MNNANISGGKKTRETITTSREDGEKKLWKDSEGKGQKSAHFEDISNKSIKDKQ